MTRKKTLLKASVVVAAGLFLLSAPSVWAQTCCEADINNDGKVNGGDLGVLKREYGTFNCVACYAPVEKTGQTTLYETGDDGDLEIGVEWPNPRFTDNGDGTITDNLTVLMWTQNAQQISGLKSWSEAINACNDLDYAGYTDWRLPNVRELQSLIHYGYYSLAVPNTAGTARCTNNADPFTNVQSDYYWSSTTCACPIPNAWIVDMSSGIVDLFVKSALIYVWPVRGEQ